jgi:hypothetical protein
MGVGWCHEGEWPSDVVGVLLLLRVRSTLKAFAKKLPANELLVTAARVNST